VSAVSGSLRSRLPGRFIRHPQLPMGLQDEVAQEQRGACSNDKLDRAARAQR
jgi:hypothetical protein